VTSTAPGVRPGTLWQAKDGDRLIGAPNALRLAVLPTPPSRTPRGHPASAHPLRHPG
jgi:hypothetical protein